MSRRRIHNADVTRCLREMALFLEMDDVPFKPQAYEKAAYAVAALDRPVADVYAAGGVKALAKLPGIGKGIAERIGHMLETGAMDDLETLRKKTPIDVLALTSIEGLGAKKARALYEALGVRNIAQLRRAAREGRIRGLPHFGKRSEEKILEALKLHEEAGGRRPLGDVFDMAHRIERSLEKLEGVDRAAVAGSIRRRRDTIGDVDVLVATSDPERVSQAFASLPEVQVALAHGPTKTTVRLTNGLDADLRVVPPESWGAALVYFTGSKAHNVALRRIAQQKGLKLNEYGLFDGKRAIASRTEEEVYRGLGLELVPPEMREDQGEVELAKSHRLPRLLEVSDIRGDLQVHTSWTDGSASIEEMAKAAQALGFEYIAITDHTRDLPMARGLDEQRLTDQAREVRKVDRRLRGIRVLTGAEVNLRPDGTLDVDEGVLAELDVVGVAIHSHFDQSRAEMTKRILRALDNPHVDLFFHPTARNIGRRRAVDFDFDAVLAACLRTGTILEIDAQPQRLDLPDTLVRKAIEAGALVAVDSDAHTVDELRFVRDFGIGVARRGWVRREQVLNALPVGKMLATLGGARRRGRHAAASA